MQPQIIKLQYLRARERKSDNILIPRKITNAYKLHLLFLATYSQHQDTKILLNRFEFVAKIVPLCGTYCNLSNTGTEAFGLDAVYWPELGFTASDVFAQINSALDQSLDCIILGPFPQWIDYPDIISNKIGEMVFAGMPLFLINHDNSSIFKIFPTAVASESISKNCLNIDVHIYNYGAGKIVVYNNGADIKRGYLAVDSCLESEFEDSLAHFCRCLVSVCQSRNKQTIKNIEYNANRLNIKLFGNPTGIFLLKIYRREDNSAVATIRTHVDSAFTFDLSNFPADKYISRIEVLDMEGKLIDWDTFYFEHQNKIEIIEAGPDKRTYKAQEQGHVSIRLNRQLYDMQLSCRWFDNWGRLLFDFRFIPFAEDFIFKVPDNSFSVINQLEIELSINKKVVKLLTFELLMPENAPEQDFPFIFWSNYETYFWRDKIYLDALRIHALGNVLYCHRNEISAKQASISHLRTIPYTIFPHKIGIDDCLFNDQWVSDSIQQAKKTAQIHRDFGAIGYSLGDEPYIDAFTSGGRFSNSETVWQNFRSYLKDIYEDISILNRQWEENYSDWSDIKINSDKELLKSFENPSPWTDFRMFIAKEFADIFRKLKATIREQHPNAPVGWDGADEFSSYDGIDWWDFTKDMDVTVVYAGPTLGCTDGFTNRTFNSQASKSFNPDAPLTGGYMNNVSYGCGSEYAPWFLLLSGYRSIWWWHASFPDPECGALKWDLSPAKMVEEISTTLKELRTGIDTMLIHSQKQYSPIAIHYSANNFHASTIESGTGHHTNNIGTTKSEFWTAEKMVGRLIKTDDEIMEMFKDIRPSGHYAPAFKNFYLLIKDLGFQPKVISRQQIEANELEKTGIKILILPFVVSLSNEEVDKITEFVKNGGMLIADYRCGFRDMHGKIRNSPALDDVFGIKHKHKSLIFRREHVSVEYNFYKGGNFECLFKDNISSSNYVQDIYNDGEPLLKKLTSVFGCHEDGSPAFIINHYFKGKALYLNFDLYSYEHLRRAKQHYDMLELFRFTFRKLAELDADVVPKYENGHPVGVIETVKLIDGPNTYHGVIPEYAIFDGNPISGYIDFPVGKHIYDVRLHRYLGIGRQMLNFMPGKPMLFAELPCCIDDLEIKAPTSATRMEKILVQIKIVTPKECKAPFVVKVEVTSPDGNIPEYYLRTLYLPEGEGNYSLSFALNALSGNWGINVTECITGISKQIYIVLV